MTDESITTSSVITAIVGKKLPTGTAIEILLRAGERMNPSLDRKVRLTGLPGKKENF